MDNQKERKLDIAKRGFVSLWGLRDFEDCTLATQLLYEGRGGKGKDMTKRMLLG